jgi:NADH-quinone oxidoreductase subunit F
MHKAKRKPTVAPQTPQLHPHVAPAGKERQDLVAALQAVQAHYHYLPSEALQELSRLFEVSLADITSVATFFNQFRFSPMGRHTIRVCIGTACHVKGAEQLAEAFRNHLKIPDDGETDPDGLFTVEKVACLGCCMLAPAIQIDDVIYGPVAKADIATILRDFLASAEQAIPETPGRSTSAEHAGEIRLCTCSSCLATNAGVVRDQLQARIDLWKLPVRLREVGCTGASHQAPLLELDTPEGCFRYGRVRPRDVDAMLNLHFRKQTPTGAMLRAQASALLDRLVDAEAAYEPPLRFPASVRDQPDAGFWCCQTRLATEHAGELDPLDLDQYLQHGGFAQFTRCLEAASPDAHRAALLQTLADAGLRGRGGAGFPTAQKWRSVANQPKAEGTLRYAICNGDEGDPGAFMDRMLLESFPLRVIEGLAIAAWTVGAQEAILYIRHEYPVAVARTREAIRLCEARGLLRSAPTEPKEGAPASQAPVAAEFLRAERPHVQVIEGAGAFVCGEETALLAAVEGQRGIPRRRPPFPSEKGLHGRPTLINNVETLALVPWLLNQGAQAFRSLGTASSPGTKTFALAGRIARGGLIEVPMGMTLREIVFNAGGGIPDGHTFKAVQVGGPSGGCIPAALADTPVDYEALTAAGAMMGSGGMVVLDERDCMVDIARYFLQFTQRESCGRCTPCRIGTRRMLQILDRLCEGTARVDDLEQLETLARQVAENSQCGLGRTAPNPVLTALRYFREEFEAHRKGICPARKCRALIRYTVTDACIGCTRCTQQCPVDAIPFTPHERAKIDQTLCTRCDGCRQVCPVNAIAVTSPGLTP